MARRTAKQEEAPKGRRRSREAEPETPRRESRSNGKDTPGHLKRGGAIFATFDKEEERAQDWAKRRDAGVAYLKTFWLPPGESREIILLDKDVESACAIHEHSVPAGYDANGKPKFDKIQCAKEVGHCALCAQYGEPYFALKLSVLDIEGYTVKKGKNQGKVVEQQKCIMSIKRGQLPSIRDVIDNAIAEHGTMRGILIKMKRPNDSKSSAIGEPVIVEKGKMYLHIPEKELRADYSNKEVKDDKGKVLKDRYFDITPFDYDLAFPAPDPDELRKRFGGRAAAGSRAEEEEEWGNTSGGGRRRGRRGADTETETEAEPQHERRSRKREEASSRARSNRDEEHEDPLASGGRRGGRGKQAEERPAASRRRR
jgi:hypothetical protein